MKRLPLAMALTAGTLLLTACSQTEDADDSIANPLLNHVPADTPFVLANLEPLPADVVDAWLLRFGPVLVDLQGSLDELRQGLQDSEITVDGVDHTQVMDAVLAEFDGKLNRQGLESLGFSLESTSAIYGQGLFPVLRIGLGDAEAFRATIARIEANSGQSIPELEYQGVSYWRASGDAEPMALYAAILDDHVVLTAAPSSRESEFLPGLLGLELPDASLGTNGALSALNREKGFSPYGSGWVDLSRVADELFESDSTTATWMADMGDFDPSAIDPACKREARLATGFVPRLVAGTRKLDADSMALRYQVETNSLLGGQLERLVADVPPASTDPAHRASASLSLQAGRVREFLLDSANALAAAPFECPQLQELNVQVQELANTLNQPMPPFIGNLKGFRAELASIDPADPQPDNVRGRLSLEMESPQMVIGMASMMVPGFEDLQIEPGADPVALPQELMAVRTPEFEAYAVMSKDAIGVSIGPGQSDGLRDFLDENGNADGVFFSVDYDMALVAEWQESAMAAQGQDADPAVSPTRYPELLGRTRMELRFDGEGLTIDQSQTFP